MTSYILYKDELGWLMRESGYRNEIFEITDGIDDMKIADGLAEKGILFESDGRYCAEKTIAFLLFQLSEAKKKQAVSDDKVSVFECPRMYIVVSEDPHNSERCKITPLQDSERLAEYLEEHNIKVIDTETEAVK